MASLPRLSIGNKCYASWSLRAWLPLKVFGIPFEEDLIPFMQPDTPQRMAAASPTGKVPALQVGDLRVWESLAIIETLADMYPEHPFWPRDRRAKAHARSISNEMHAGFQALRREMPMNFGKRYARMAAGAELQADIDRIVAIWRDTRARFGKGGPFLFGQFTAADAMFAPVVSRFETHAVAVDPDARAYMTAVQSLPAYKEWESAALREPWTMTYSELPDPVADLRIR